MKTLFINTTNDCRNNRIVIPACAGVTMLLSVSAFCFQTDVAPIAIQQPLSPLQIVEAGRADEKNVPAPLFYLSEGDYKKSFESLTPEIEASQDWLKSYLE